jgi:hypothetical protein
MTTPFTIGLTIRIPDGGRHARKLLNLYHSDMTADLNTTALKLCDAKPAVQAHRFAKLTLKRAEVWSGQEDSLTIFALFTVTAEDASFIKKVISQYMDGFAGFMQQASTGYYAPASFPPDISLQPTDWSVEVNRNPHG